VNLPPRLKILKKDNEGWGKYFHIFKRYFFHSTLSEKCPNYASAVVHAMEGIGITFVRGMTLALTCIVGLG
jgi:hypothetical protein